MHNIINVKSIKPVKCNFVFSASPGDYTKIQKYLEKKAGLLHVDKDLSSIPKLYYYEIDGEIKGVIGIGNVIDPIKVVFDGYSWKYRVLSVLSKLSVKYQLPDLHKPLVFSMATLPYADDPEVMRQLVMFACSDLQTCGLADYLLLGTLVGSDYQKSLNSIMSFTLPVSVFYLQRAMPNQPLKPPPLLDEWLYT